MTLLACAWLCLSTAAGGSLSERLAQLKFEFVRIAPGEFLMGSDAGEDAERPPHRVRITHAFEIGRYEVTQAQWEAVMGEHPSFFKEADRPVEKISWHEVQEFLNKLNGMNDGYRYRLPTEAEWEYAARAGANGDTSGSREAVAWYWANAGQTHPVGQKQANAWGLHDMLGNVWEWCQDWYEEGYYRVSPSDDPSGPASGTARVIRGGSWIDQAKAVRVAKRVKSPPDSRLLTVGFRCARDSK